MKYLKLFESYNPIRDEIEANIKFILLELQDCKSHYKSKIVWDVPWSYIYITGEKKGVFGIHKPIFSEVQPIIGEIVAYLDSEGFQTTVKYKPDKENCREFFIYILPENIKVNESFNIDEDSEHLKDLSLDLKDEGEWSINVYTNTEKYNDDEYSCKVILEPLDEFDWDGDDDTDKGGKINDTLIQYLENIVKYMEDYEYKIILTDDNDLAPPTRGLDQYEEQEIILNSIEEFKNWVQKELKHQQSNIMTYGFKGDLIIIEFYEKDDLF